MKILPIYIPNIPKLERTRPVQEIIKTIRLGHPGKKPVEKLLKIIKMDDIIPKIIKINPIKIEY